MKLPGSCGFPLVLACGLGMVNVPAQAATPAFTISATNVTLPADGSAASSPFTLTSVNGYSGQVRVDCSYAGSTMGAKVPSCGIYVNPQHNLGANQAVTGTLTLFPYGKVPPYAAARRQGSSPYRAPALAGVLLGSWLLLRRRRSGIRSLLLVVLGGFALAGMISCSTALSGTFPYTVTATDVSTHTVVSAPFSVTVP